MSELEPIAFAPRRTSGAPAPSTPASASIAAAAIASGDQGPRVAFTRAELSAILDVYGRKVAAGEWRDYAIDMGRETASFSVYRRASECPLLRIEKAPKLSRRQGAYSIVMATGLIVKRGPDLSRVLNAFEKVLRLVEP